jgi:predicted phage terminase large subunit-like protein
MRRGWHVIEPAQPYVHGWHIDAIAEHLEAVTDGQINRLLINVPPGMMKSLATSVFWPAWEWGPVNRPSTRILGTSYSESYAIRDAARMRNLVQSEWYQGLWGERVQLTKAGEKKFENAAMGWREGIPFSRMTGGRGDRVIIDDPHSTESAESDAERQRTIRIFLESVPTRLNNPETSAIVVIMQRLHEEDVSGVILSKDLGYEHLMLPMEYDPSRHCVTSIGFEDPRTEDGELIFPERFPRHVVNRDKVPMGPYAVAGQFQQAPTPRGGGIFKREWWQDWDEPAFPPCEYIVASLDTAYTEKQENDYSALTVWGVFRDANDLPRVMLMNAWRGRLALHGPDLTRERDETPRDFRIRQEEAKGLVEKVADICRKFKVDRLLIEAKANGIPVAQEIRRLHSGEGWSVQMVNPREEKVARAYAVQPLFSDGMVYAPDRAWADMVKDEASSFPKVAHDDLTDSMTQALKHLRETGILVHGAEVAREITEASTHRGGKLKPLYPV